MLKYDWQFLSSSYKVCVRRVEPVGLSIVELKPSARILQKSAYNSTYLGMNVMKLRSSPSSPFGRKVKMATYILGFADDVEPILTDTLDPNDSICDVNPLGKIPALEDEGKTYFDSRVIMEYLDAKAGGGKIIPVSGSARYEALTRAALMDGMLDAAVLIVYESRMRPDDKYVESVVIRQREKIIRGLKAVVASAPSYRNGAMPDVGEIGLACVLDYLDFRKQLNWRDHAGNLEGWLADFAANVPGFAESAPPKE